MSSDLSFKINKLIMDRMDPLMIFADEGMKRPLPIYQMRPHISINGMIGASPVQFTTYWYDGVGKSESEVCRTSTFVVAVTYHILSEDVALGPYIWQLRANMNHDPKKLFEFLSDLDAASPTNLLAFMANGLNMPRKRGVQQLDRGIWAPNNPPPSPGELLVQCKSYFSLLEGWSMGVKFVKWASAVPGRIYGRLAYEKSVATAPFYEVLPLRGQRADFFGTTLDQLKILR